MSKSEEAIEKMRTAGNWRPMEELPFYDYHEISYREEGRFLVTDGVNVTVARVKDAFGTPSGYHPAWSKKWALEDELSPGSECYGKDDVGFWPTHWMPMPLPPK